LIEVGNFHYLTSIIKQTQNGEMGISIENLNKLETLFETKNWEIEKDVLKFSSTFNRFCSRLDLFDDEKQKLLIDLGYEFIDLGQNDFQPCFINAINKIEDIDKYKSIIVAPLQNPNSRETKSAGVIWYHLKNVSDFTYEPFGNKLYFTSSTEEINKALSKKDVILILIDDFIGTGQTVIEVLDEFFESKILKVDDPVRVLSFIAQHDGLSFIHSKYPDTVIYDIGLKKALTDKYSGSDLEVRLKHMSEMEKKLNVKPDFEFGYGRSESLVSVSKRSANNTFPVFWLEKKNKLAPFKR
jgi:hypothetical protein